MERNKKPYQSAKNWRGNSNNNNYTMRTPYNERGFSRHPRNPSDQKDENNRLSLKKINDYVDKQPEDILIQLESPHFGLKSYLEAQTMSDEMVKVLAILFEKVLHCNSMNTKLTEIARRFVDSRFFNHHLYNAIETEASVHPFHCGLSNYQSKILLRTVLNISCLLLELYPDFIDSLRHIKDKIELEIMKQDNKELKDLFENRFKALVQKIMKKREAQRNRTFKNMNLSDLEPPTDFIEMSIEPKLEDVLCDQQPFLRKNITNGAYKSVHHYLDVQFRLLREDFFQPLREGIGKFRDIIKKSEISLDQLSSSKVELSVSVKRKLNKIESLNVYYDVNVHETELSSVGMIYKMKLSDAQKNVDWEYSKKLIYGSMVCLSSDFFTGDYLIGIICEREMKDLSKGVISIRFSYDSMQAKENSSFPSRNRTYTMLETTAFFESYKHVLESLKKFGEADEATFPFKKHLVDADNRSIERPDYLKNACLDMR